MLDHAWVWVRYWLIKYYDNSPEGDLIITSHCYCARCGASGLAPVILSCDAQLAQLMELRLIGDSTEYLDQRTWIKNKLGFEVEVIDTEVLDHVRV